MTTISEGRTQGNRKKEAEKDSFGLTILRDGL
jgi:hypothetical protein